MISKTENIVRSFIHRHHLLDESKKYIVALSGGGDSVAMLLMLKHMGYHIEAAHCNFHLRGEEANRDEQFCVDLCEQLCINLHRIHFDTLTYAQLHKQSIEMAARELRYRYFNQLLKDIDAQAICVAHHKDDSVETILINLLRGTGINGLTGIAPRNGNIIRPLLCICRNDIMHYLQEQHQDYVTDSTNLEDDVVRNKIRLHVIPLLQSITPAACDNILTTAQYLLQAKATLQQSIDQIGQLADAQGIIHINKKDLMQQASPAFALHALVSPYGFNGATIQEVIASIQQPGKQWTNHKYKLLIDRDDILIANNTHCPETADRPFVMPEDGKYNLQDGTIIRLRCHPKPLNFTPSKDTLRITIDADKISWPLQYRLTKQGDRFRPFGMKGSKLVSDYLTDKKRTLLEKQSQHVLVDAQGQIIWLVGERTADTCKTDKDTTHILEVKIENEQE